MPPSNSDEKPSGLLSRFTGMFRLRRDNPQSGLEDPVLSYEQIAIGLNNLDSLNDHEIEQLRIRDIVERFSRKSLLFFNQQKEFLRQNQFTLLLSELALEQARQIGLDSNYHQRELGMVFCGQHFDSSYNLLCVSHIVPIDAQGTQTTFDAHPDQYVGKVGRYSDLLGIRNPFVSDEHGDTTNKVYLRSAIVHTHPDYLGRSFRAKRSEDDMIGILRTASNTDFRQIWGIVTVDPKQNLYMDVFRTHPEGNTDVTTILIEQGKEWRGYRNRSAV